MPEIPEMETLEDNPWKELEELRSVSDYFEENSVSSPEEVNSVDIIGEEEIRGEKQADRDENERFVCPECGEEFNSQIELNSHSSLSHRDVSEESVETDSLFERIYERAKENYERILENTQETIKETYSRINSYASDFLEEAKETAKEAYNLVDYFPDVQMEKVNSYELGEGVLGRAFPWKDKIQIHEGLYGLLEDKVIEHELEHIENPWKSELQVRIDTGTLYLTF